MNILRTIRMLRVAAVIFGLAVLLGAPHKAMGQESNNLEDDECYDIGYGTGCDVEGFAMIAANAQEVDSYVETDIDFSVADDGWYAYVEGDIYAGSSFLDYCTNEGDLETDCSMVDSTVLNTFYALGGYHGVDDGFGDGFIAGQTVVWISAVAPTVTSIEPMYAYVGTTGEILVQGSYLLDPNTDDFTVYLTPASNGNTSGMGISSDGVSPDGTVAQVGYTLTTCAGTGGRFINIATSFGYDNGDIVFNVGDPTPTILSVSPGVWKAGTTSLPITVTGIGFGSAPTLSVVGNGVTLLSSGGGSDTQITGTVSISSSAPAQTATVSVQSNGYCGSGFQPANNNSSIGTSGVPVQPVPAPTPTIQLYGQNITTTQSVVVGQQIALTATVPQGTTVQSQQWSLPGGTVVGGYTASTNGPGCVVLIQGQSQSGACSGNPVSTTNSSFAFYWVDSGAGSQQTVTYTYTATNGESASATATFSIDAPSGVTVGAPPGSQLQSTVNIVNPPTNTDHANPQLLLGSPGVYGMNLLATASYLPAGGQYQWVQLISEDVSKVEANGGPLTCPAVSASGTPELDNKYPYGTAGTTVTTTHVTNDGANDGPAAHLTPGLGEVARSFNATMYLMWIPPILTTPIQCPNGSACTMPVPMGNLQWQFSGDGINTLKSINANGLTFPSWLKYNAYDTNTGYVDDNTFPTWSTTFVNGGVTCQ